MMKAAFLFLAVVVTAFSPLPSRAAGGITIENAYSFAVAPGARSAAAFMTIVYPPSADGTTIPDRLMRVETPVAGRADMHTVLIEDNAMAMRKVDVLPLSPMGTMTFSPQGAHIMMMELRQPLVAGETYPMTLVFEKAGPVEIAVPVRAPGDVPEAATSSPAGEPPEEKDVHQDMMDDMPEHHH